MVLLAKFVIYTLSAYVLGLLRRPKWTKVDAGTGPAPGPQDRTIPVVFGTRWVLPVNLWYGDLRMTRTAIGDTRTMGFNWWMGWHFGIAHRPVDSVLAIRGEGYQPTVDRWYLGLIWDQALEDHGWLTDYHVIADNERIEVDNLFAYGGATTGESGGVQGYVDIEFGADDQPQNDYLQTQLGTDIPAYRGILGAVLRQCHVGSNAADVPSWMFQVRHQGAYGIGTYDIGANAIVSEAVTNATWGLGLDSARIDSDSFAAAYATLAGEGLGMSLAWDTTQPVQELLDLVMRHIHGVAYVEPATGKVVLKLIREDYTPADLPVLDEANLSNVEAYTRPALEECTNTLIATYTDRNGNEQTYTIHDTALIVSQGSAINAAEVAYEAFCDEAAVEVAAARDLRALSRPLSTAVVVGTRELAALRPGDPVKLSWDAFGIDEEIMRVAKVDCGTAVDGKVRLHLEQDIYGTSEQVAATPRDTAWGGILDRVDDILYAPPGSPSEGDTYLVGVGATGAWAGHDNEIAYWDGSQWVFTSPGAGKVVVVASDDLPYRYNEDAEWAPYAGGLVAVDHAGTWEDPVPVSTGSIWRHASGGLRYKDDVAPASDDDGVEFGFGQTHEVIP